MINSEQRTKVRERLRVKVNHIDNFLHIGGAVDWWFDLVIDQKHSEAFLSF